METIYAKIGPGRLRQLVDKFYDIVFFDSEIAHLFDANKSQIRDKQYRFLTQFLGGPGLYTEKFGHPKMKVRHLPHAIGQKEKDEWLRCMKRAIKEMNFEDNLGESLYNCFPHVAEHMVNR